MNPKRIVMLGDSLTAGYGLRAGEALPARLQTELANLGVDTVVRNAGVSGDTSADGLRRLDQDVPADTELCIVALGANDMMQMVPCGVVKANLGAILERLAARSVPAMICGMRAPPWFASGPAMRPWLSMTASAPWPFWPIRRWVS